MRNSCKLFGLFPSLAEQHIAKTSSTVTKPSFLFLAYTLPPALYLGLITWLIAIIAAIRLQRCDHYPHHTRLDLAIQDWRRNRTGGRTTSSLQLVEQADAPEFARIQCCCSFLKNTKRPSFSERGPSQDASLADAAGPAGIAGSLDCNPATSATNTPHGDQENVTRRGREDHAGAHWLCTRIHISAISAAGARALDTRRRAAAGGQLERSHKLPAAVWCQCSGRSIGLEK